MTMTTMTMLVLLQLHCPHPPSHPQAAYTASWYMCVCALDWVEKSGKEIAAKGEEQDTRETIAKIVQPATMRCVCAAVCVYMCVCAFVLAKIVARKIELQLQQRQGGGGVRGGREPGTAMTRT